MFTRVYYLFAIEARKVMVGEGRPRVVICHEELIEGKTTTDQLADRAGCTIQEICGAIVRFEQHELVRVLDTPASNGCRIIEILYNPEEIMDVLLGSEPKDRELAVTLPVLRGFEKELSLEDRQLEIAACLSSVPGSKKIYMTSVTARLILDCLNGGVVAVESELGQKVERLLVELPDLRKAVGRGGQGFFDRIRFNGNVRFRVNRQMAGRCLIVPAKAGEGNRTARLRTREFRSADHWVIALNALAENRPVPEFVVRPRTSEEQVLLPEVGIAPRAQIREVVSPTSTPLVIPKVEETCPVPTLLTNPKAEEALPLEADDIDEASTPVEVVEPEIELPIPPAPEVEEMPTPVFATDFIVRLPIGSAIVVQVPLGSVDIEDPVSLTDEDLENRIAAVQQLSEAALSLAKEYIIVLTTRRAAALAALEEEVAAAERALAEKRVMLEELRRQSGRT